jgi:2'-5' RNA ligase
MFPTVDSAMAESRIAVALAFLPPAAVSRLVVTANRRLPSAAIRLGPTARPHITLAMACIDRRAVPEIAEQLAQLADAEPAVEVTLTRAVTIEGSGHATAWLEAALSRGLRRWHRLAVTLLESYRRPGPRAAGFAPGPGRVSASARRWVRRYAQDAALAHYRPHITIGYGDAPTVPHLPIPFLARRIVLCHLGNHCTCARVLAERHLLTSGRLRGK